MGSASNLHGDTSSDITKKLHNAYIKWVEREKNNLSVFIRALEESLWFQGICQCKIKINQRWAGCVPDGVIWRVDDDTYPGIVFEIGVSQRRKGPKSLEEKAGDWLEYSKNAINRVWTVKMDYGVNNSTVAVQEFSVKPEKRPDGKLIGRLYAHNAVVSFSLWIYAILILTSMQEIRNKDGIWAVNIPAVMNIRVADMVFSDFVDQNPDPHWEHTFELSSDDLNKIIDAAEKRQRKGMDDRESGENEKDIQFATDSNKKRVWVRDDEEPAGGESSSPQRIQPERRVKRAKQ